MYTLLISGGFGLLLLLTFGFTELSNWVWAVIWGFIAFFTSNALIGFHFKHRVDRLSRELQTIMTNGQRQIQEKTQAWRFRPPGSVKQAQIEIQKMQHGFIQKAIEHTATLEHYKHWIPLLDRQIATMRMQLHYQDRNFKEVDALMPKCLILDPMTAALVIARLYSRDGYKPAADKKGRPTPNKIDRIFSKATARLRYGQGATLYGLYAWIKIQVNDIDGAFNVLQLANKKMENACIKNNIDLLKNNKPKHFSLAALGDEWYALGLEEPRIKMQRQPQRPY